MPTIHRIIVGTAGHIDHGKTSLIRALTGIDADRLKEEKKRGLTIDLGFAFLDLPSGKRLGIIDVPGHEKFIKNMVAGATGIDIVLLVVAADDGVMPQTREHLDIMTILGIQRGLVALTKIDLVDEDLLELALEDIREYLQGTFLADAPIIPVSSTTGEGIDKLRQKLYDIAQASPPRSAEGVFRMPIQRVFAAKGYGTVITGIPVSGSVGIGERVEILPGGVQGRVRAIQAYKEPIDQALAGHSTALNLAEVNYKILHRGMSALRPGVFSSTKLVEGEFFYLPHHKRTLCSYTQIKLHTGTSETFGKLVILDRREILPGEKGIIQIILSNPVVVGHNDRYILRLPSPPLTLGGGVLWGSSTKRWKARANSTLAYIEKKKNDFATPEGRVRFLLEEEGIALVKISSLQRLSLLDEKHFQQTLQQLLQRGDIVEIPNSHSYIAASQLKEAQEKVISQIEDFHHTHPLSWGIGFKQLQSAFSQWESTLFGHVLTSLLNAKKLKKKHNLYSLFDFSPKLTQTQNELKQKIEADFLTALFSPPRFEEVCEKYTSSPQQKREFASLFQLLCEEGTLIPLSNNLYFHQQALQKAKDLVISYLQKHPVLLSSEAKSLFSASRKFTIPLLEYLDSQGITYRQGNERRLAST
ncbi:MAG: selenocysteine-specific translation elongation factor [Planctomycetota bacterium]|nr:MAG: selenocysteine-specific translation elongation factor [Planctomycetota bacterium]